MRVLNNQMALFNHHVSAQVALKDVDLDCLELLNATGRSAPARWRGSPGCTRRP